MLHSRDRRVAEQIKEVLSNLFTHEINDPRRPKIFTISDVAVAKDLRHAKIYYSQLPDDEQALEKTQEMIADSVAYLRSRVAAEINMRMTPELQFQYDPSHRNYQRINTLLQGGDPDILTPNPKPKVRRKRR